MPILNFFAQESGVTESGVRSQESGVRSQEMEGGTCRKSGCDPATTTARLRNAHQAG
ncbi:MAG: hypothetical protein WBA93_35145 [Microcoleaceae cyanobacterium]